MNYISVNDLVNAISEEEIFYLLKKFEEMLQHQARFLCNCMHMYKLLLFIRATSQGIWNLHLTSLELMIPFFPHMTCKLMPV